MVTEIEPPRSPDLTPLEFCLWGWMKSEVSKRKVDTREELLALILDVAAGTKKREDQLRRKTRDIRTRVAKVIVVEGGISEYIL